MIARPATHVAVHLVAHIIHLLVLLLPTITLSPRDGWNGAVIAFGLLVGLAAALESLAIRPDDSAGSRVQDPWALHVAGLVGALMLVLFWGAQIESLLLDQTWRPWQLAGGASVAMGIGLRVAAIRTLGSSFVSDIRNDQPIIEHGIYRWIAHPSELGLLLIATGAPLILSAPVTAGIAIVLLAPISVWRIRRENMALQAQP